MGRQMDNEIGDHLQTHAEETVMNVNSKPDIDTEINSTTFQTIKYKQRVYKKDMLHTHC